ncbi:Dihydroorotate dehydrogenase class 1/ 2 [Neofusicoccum parvum]|nr:Dihydroorotate dehydrogenase class 1/ 2 [Neofusicoccum parvum]
MPLDINPPLLNSANPWATDLAQLRALYASPYTGAITTRTSLLAGFPHDDAVNQYTFFSPTTQAPAPGGPNPTPSTTPPTHTGSLNTLGYSPHPLSTYLAFAATLSAERPPSLPPKPIILSVTGPPADAAACYALIASHAATLRAPLAMELNLSCPNIPDKPPPAHSRAALADYLRALAAVVTPAVPLGLKVPPYAHAGAFAEFVGALADVRPSPVSFVTAVNTLAPALVLRGEGLEGALGSVGGSGVGGMAGAPLHPVALGNVLSLREAMGRVEGLGHVMVIGVGGVEDADGWRRMRRVGAGAVGVGTALGRFGVDVFEKIWKGVEGPKL